MLKPYGAWAVITPFNFPLALAAGPAAAALITGNTVVLKGASATPWAGRLLADCIRDAGLPAGVFNYLSGSSAAIGATLVDHPLTAGVTFTGSYEVGRQIAHKLQSGRYPRPCIAEMGGKNACIVTAGADLERAAAGIIRSAFGMGGQKCSALSRLYVHRQVADALIERLLQQCSALTYRRSGTPRELARSARDALRLRRLRALLRTAARRRRPHSHRRRATARRGPGARFFRAADARRGAARARAVAGGDVPAHPDAAPGGLER